MPSTKILQLRVTDPLGNYLTAAELRLTPEHGEEVLAQSDDRGLVFLQLPAGTYRLQAQCRGFFRQAPIRLQRDESLTVRLFPLEAADLTIHTTNSDNGHRAPLPAYIVIRGDVPCFPTFADADYTMGAIFTDERGTASILLPPGQYMIKATHGFTHRPVEEHIHLAAGDSRVLHFDLPQEFTPPSGWYCGDDHVHCLQCWPGHHPGCPDFPVDVTARAARANGLDWFTPTDNLDPASALHIPLVERAAQTIAGEFICLVGDETGGANADGGFHANLLGLDGPIGTQGVVPRLEDEMEGILRQGGTANVCHIFLAPGSIREIDETPTLPNLEVWCCEDDLDRTLPLWYGYLNQGRTLYAVAHSDSTNLYQASRDFVGVRRTYAHVGPDPLSQETILAALKAGHSFCTDGPLLFLKIDGRIPGQRLGAEKRVEVDISAFSLTPLTKVSLIAGGRKIREWEASGNRFQITEAVDVETFPWMLATVEAEQTVYAPARKYRGFAFTNPVWMGDTPR